MEVGGIFKQLVFIVMLRHLNLGIRECRRSPANLINDFFSLPDLGSDHVRPLNGVRYSWEHPPSKSQRGARSQIISMRVLSSGVGGKSHDHPKKAHSSNLPLILRLYPIG